MTCQHCKIKTSEGTDTCRSCLLTLAQGKRCFNCHKFPNEKPCRFRAGLEEAPNLLRRFSIPMTESDYTGDDTLDNLLATERAKSVISTTVEAEQALMKVARDWLHKTGPWGQKTGPQKKEGGFF